MSNEWMCLVHSQVAHPHTGAQKRHRKGLWSRRQRSETVSILRFFPFCPPGPFTPLSLASPTLIINLPYFPSLISNSSAFEFLTEMACTTECRCRLILHTQNKLEGWIGCKSGQCLSGSFQNRKTGFIFTTPSAACEFFSSALHKGSQALSRFGAFFFFAHARVLENCLFPQP